MPDDPLREDALVPHEDVLHEADPGPVRDGAAAADLDAADAGPAGHASALDQPTAAVVLDDRPTTELPRLPGTPAPAPQHSWTAGMAPWAVFAVVAVLVVAATSTWAAWLRPTSDQHAATPRIATVPTTTVNPPTPEAVVPPPEPTAEPEPEPEPDPEPAPRATQRPQPARERAPEPRAPAPAPPAATGDGESSEAAVVPGPAACTGSVQEGPVQENEAAPEDRSTGERSEAGERQESGEAGETGEVDADEEESSED